MRSNAVTPSSLPPLLAPWIDEALGGPIPNERHATCSDYAMSKPQRHHGDVCADITSERHS
jgi:hypothetical protein